jgi:ABC-type bacteriocin/lantibiotic exporter with double-glycine peptidase domain
MISFKALQIFKRLDHSTQIRLIKSGFLMSLTSVLDLLSLGLFMSLLLLFTAPDKLFKFLETYKLNFFIYKNDFFSLALIVFVFFFICAQLIKILIIWKNSKFLDEEKKEISLKIIHGILDCPSWAEDIKHQSYYLNLLTTEVNHFIQMGLRNYVNIFQETILLASIFTAGIFFAPISIAIIVTIAIPLFILLRLLNAFRIKYLANMRNIADESKMLALQQIFILIKDIYINQKEAYFSNIYESKLDRLVYIERMQSIIRQLLRPISEIYIIITVGIIFIILSSGQDYEYERLVSLLLVTFVMLIKVLPSANKIQSSLYDINYIYPTLNQLSEIISNHRNKKISINDLALASTLKNTINEGLLIKDLQYFYPNCNQATLNIPFLHIPNNQLFLIKGKSGAGKSTLIDLMLGIKQPTKGTISYNGLKIKYKNSDYLSEVAYVGQNIYLVDGTLADNVAFGVPKDMINGEKVIDLLQSVDLKHLIVDRAGGLNQKVIGSDSQFSIGEKQRIGIARALYKLPKVLFLDEITSSVDSETRNLIYKVIETIVKERLCTVILITHDDHCPLIFDGQLIL